MKAVAAADARTAGLAPTLPIHILRDPFLNLPLKRPKSRDLEQSQPDFFLRQHFACTASIPSRSAALSLAAVAVSKLSETMTLLPSRRSTMTEPSSVLCPLSFAHRTR